VADEADNPARIRKAYQLLLGRAPTSEEIEAGVQYLRTEPMKAYEEAKAREKEKKPKRRDESEKDESAESPATTEAAGGAPPMGVGMLAGMGGPGGRRGVPPKPDAKPMLPVTVWGRYAKILMSSPEFTFIN
jgi:hypothetical protein